MKLSFALPLAAVLGLGLAASAPAQLIGKPSKADQVRLGKQAAQEVRRKERVLPSSDARVQTVRRVGSRLLSVVDDRNQPWEYSFDVIDNKQVNAFAFPGGPMFIYTGLLDRMKTEDELAGVLAHEIAHVRHEHWATAYGQRQTQNLGLAVVLGLFRANRTITDLAGIGKHMFVDLPYSRNHELAADDEAFQMMVHANYHPQGLADLFVTLRNASGGGRPAEFLSTHPADQNRINRVNTRLQQANRNFPQMTPLAFTTSRERWQQQTSIRDGR
jgi:beta-barrel assembly-enhancing protease